MKLLEEEDRKKETNKQGLNIKNKCCEKCLYGEDPHIEWEHGKEIENNAFNNGNHFCCHEYQNVMCHGYYNRYKTKLWYIKLAKTLNAIRWV